MDLLLVNKRNSLEIMKLCEIISNLRINEMNKKISLNKIKEQINEIHESTITHYSDDNILLCPLSIIRRQTQLDTSDNDCKECFACLGSETIIDENKCIIIINNEYFNYSLNDFKEAILFYIEELENNDE